MFVELLSRAVTARLELLGMQSMEEGCELCDFVTPVLSLFACRPRAARAMAVVLQGGWLPSAAGTESASCTCSLQDAQWLFYVTDLQESPMRPDDYPHDGEAADRVDLDDSSSTSDW